MYSVHFVCKLHKNVHLFVNVEWSCSLLRPQSVSFWVYPQSSSLIVLQTLLVNVTAFVPPAASQYGHYGH
jgi:hypothetical protein